MQSAVVVLVAIIISRLVSADRRATLVGQSHTLPLALAHFLDDARPSVQTPFCIPIPIPPQVWLYGLDLAAFFSFWLDLFSPPGAVGDYKQHFNRYSKFWRSCNLKYPTVFSLNIWWIMIFFTKDLDLDINNLLRVSISISKFHLPWSEKRSYVL